MDIFFLFKLSDFCGVLNEWPDNVGAISYGPDSHTRISLISYHNNAIFVLFR